MRRFTWMACGVVAVVGLMVAADDQPSDSAPAIRQAKYRSSEKPAELVSRTYNVADLVVPLGTAGTRPARPRFDDLLAYIRRESDARCWEREGASIRPYEATMSLVIRQTPDVHAQLADVLGRLRRTLDVQVRSQFLIVRGPRRAIVELVRRFPGELGRHEAEELQQALKDSAELSVISRPQVSVLNAATAMIQIDDQSSGVAIPVQHTVSDDRRSIRVRISATRGRDAEQILANSQSLDLYDGRTSAIHFEAERVIPGLPPADDAEELLVIVTPRIVVQEEEEELLGIPTEGVNARIGTVTPRIIVQEEEEELLGIPTGNAE